MKQTQPSRAASRLPVMIRLTAVGYLLFVVPDLILASVHHINGLPPLFARLFDWGEGGGRVAVMFSTVYLVWALFLFGSARAPLANRLFLDFNLTANCAHFGAMLVMAVTMRDQHQHLAGVLALGLITTVPLVACWLPVRHGARTLRCWRHTARHGGVGIAQRIRCYPRVRSTVLGLPEKVRACLFDLDGVLTDTASVHTKAWKAMFDAYLSERAKRTGEKFVPFDPAADYRQYVDGKKREDGVRSFLSSRGIELPDGSPDDPDDAETIYGLGKRKNEMFQKVLHEQGVEVFDGSRRYLEAVSAAGLGIAVVSSSANTRDVLEITGLDRFVQQRVDGITLREEHIAGKPAPDSFLRGAQLLNVGPDAAAVFEDALSGVQAGRAGKFGFVVGVDRVGQADDLRRNGADVVVTDLADLLQS